MTATAPQDEELIARSREGDAGSFEELVRRHEERVFNTMYRMVGAYETAADLTQEAFLNAYRGLAQFRGGARFSTWIYRIAANAAFSYLRRQARRPNEVTLDSAGQDPPAAENTAAPDGAAEQKERAALVQQALLELEVEDRQIIVLRDLEERDYDEIAQILDCPRGTVKSRLFRARQTLRAKVLGRTQTDRDRPHRHAGDAGGAKP